MRGVLRRAALLSFVGLALLIAAATTAAAQTTLADDDGTTTLQPDWPQPTEVVLAVTVNNIWIDERETRFELDAVLAAAWFDQRLAFECVEDGFAFNDRLYQGDRARDLLKSEIWWPDFALDDGIGPRQSTSIGVAITCDGFVFYEERFLAEVHQPFDLNEFPFDTQAIDLAVSSFSQFSDRVVFVGVDEYFGDEPGTNEASLGESEFSWSTTEWTVDDRGFATPVLDNVEYPTATFSASLDRSSNYYVLNVILPLLLIVSMSWAVFWMDFGRMTLADRLGVSLTSLLTVVAFDFLTDDQLPKLSYSTRLDNLYVTSYVFVGLTVLVSVVGEVRLGGEGEDRAERVIRLDRWARIVFPVGYALAVGIALLGPVKAAG